MVTLCTSLDGCDRHLAASRAPQSVFRHHQHAGRWKPLSSSLTPGVRSAQFPRQSSHVAVEGLGHSTPCDTAKTVEICPQHKQSSLSGSNREEAVPICLWHSAASAAWEAPALAELWSQSPAAALSDLKCSPSFHFYWVSKWEPVPPPHEIKGPIMHSLAFSAIKTPFITRTCSTKDSLAAVKTLTLRSNAHLHKDDDGDGLSVMQLLL